ncbi:MAG: shikimate kinase [Clostridia bacterium]|nr:shikimate kinase [Clostridia bacterium]
MNIVLCGMMGSGKSTVGQALSRLTGKPFVDTDTRIEEKYGLISDIFAKHGEEYFRGLETQTVKELCQCDGLIIATGGGLVLRQENTNLLKEKGCIVYLRAEFSTLEKRLAGDTKRPLLRSGRLEELLKERAPVYERAADFTVCVDQKTPEEIAKGIIEKITPER